MAYDLIEKNPALKDPVLAVLESMVQVMRETQAQASAGAQGAANKQAPTNAETTSDTDAGSEGNNEITVDRSAVENAAQLVWKSHYRHTPALTVDILVRNSALNLTTLVNGEPYDGTLEDVQLDLSIPDDAEAVCDLTLTDYGREILQDYRPEVLLASLLADKAAYQPIFDAVLQKLTESESASRTDLEEVVNGFEELTHNRPNDHQQTVYPQFFLDTLEEAGGIAWADGGWQITDAGRAFLAKQQAAA